ncbi:MAG: hypothetical protein FWG68_12055 [Defluviitaleaceae bacterium]|nr:hypothetical protein [Defluviitaleaceae bacterium]
MAKVTTEKFADAQFGNCVKITNGLVELHVTVDYGPRVIYCSCVGMDNMFFQDTTKAPLDKKYNVYDDQIILYGGHRVWISPEVVPRCYHPDNVPVTVENLPNGAKFLGAVEKHNQIQKSITITLAEDSPKVKVVNAIQNVGLWDIEMAVWGITMLAAGGIEVMPMPDRNTGLLPNRNFTFWDYTNLGDSRIKFGKEYLTLLQDSTQEQPFKLGYNNEKGWAAYLNKDQIFLKTFSPVLGGNYPDNGCCFETYTNAKMIEMETLGEIKTVAPGETIEISEEWALINKVEALDAKDVEVAIKLNSSVSAFLPK